jgi:hypothetical protein
MQLNNLVGRSVLACACMGAFAFANAQTVCEPLTPAALNDITAAIEHASTVADVAAVAAGADKDSPSTYPNSLIRVAAQRWQSTYLDYFPADTYVPYITPINVALSLNGAPNIEVNNWLIGARWWSTASAYHYHVTNTPLAVKYLEVRRAVQIAMDKMDALGYNGARCSMLQNTPELASLLP